MRPGLPHGGPGFFVRPSRLSQAAHARPFTSEAWCRPEAVPSAARRGPPAAAGEGVVAAAGGGRGGAVPARGSQPRRPVALLGVAPPHRALPLRYRRWRRQSRGSPLLSRQRRSPSSRPSHEASRRWAKNWHLQPVHRPQRWARPGRPLHRLPQRSPAVEPVRQGASSRAAAGQCSPLGPELLRGVPTAAGEPA
jgi:hypothetical protein